MIKLSTFLARYNGDYDSIEFFHYALHSFLFRYNYLIENYDLDKCFVYSFFKDPFDVLCVEFVVEE